MQDIKIDTDNLYGIPSSAKQAVINDSRVAVCIDINMSSHIYIYTETDFLAT